MGRESTDVCLSACIHYGSVVYVMRVVNRAALPRLLFLIDIITYRK
jgi:hypothetical protein